VAYCWPEEPNKEEAQFENINYGLLGFWLIDGDAPSARSGSNGAAFKGECCLAKGFPL
jgi:hypothetical protein